MEDVGIRELRQHLSRYLRRVARGETLRVRERGRPVALLAPIPEGASLLEQLVAAGRVRRPTLDLAAIGAPAAAGARMPISAALAADREETDP